MMMKLVNYVSFGEACLNKINLRKSSKSYLKINNQQGKYLNLGIVVSTYPLGRKS